MSNLITFITNGATEFTPDVMVGIIVFVVIFDGICAMVSAMLKGVRR